MRLIAIAIVIMLAQSASAHSVLYFDHAIPAVGSTVDKKSVRYISLFFSEQYDSGDIDVKLANGSRTINTQIIHPADNIVAAMVKERLPAGIYYVSWKDRHHQDDQWHTFKFEAADVRRPD